MKFRMVHNNLNVFDLDKSIKFYQDAFAMHEVRRINSKDGSFIIVYLEDGNSSHQLELTWLRDWERPYDLGDNEFHLAFKVDDYEAAQVILKYEKELSHAKQNLSPLGRQRLFDEFTRELRRFTKKQYKDNLVSIPFDYIALNQDTELHIAFKPAPKEA